MQLGGLASPADFFPDVGDKGGDHLCAHALAFMAWNGRYDMLAYLLGTLFVILLVEGRGTLKASCAIGFLMPWVSLPTLAFTLSTVGWLVPQGWRWRHVGLHLLGALAGFVALAGFAGEKVGLSHFLEILKNLYLSVPSGTLFERWTAIQIDLLGFAGDRFWIFGAPVLAFLLLCRGRFAITVPEESNWLLRWICAGISAGLICAAVYKMNILYFWMIAVPLAFLFCSCLRGSFLGIGNGSIILGLGLVLIITGLPGRLMLGFGRLGVSRDNHEKIQRALADRQNGAGKLVCYTEWPFYYDVKTRNTYVVGPPFVEGAPARKVEPDLFFVTSQERLPEPRPDVVRIRLGPVGSFASEAGIQKIFSCLPGTEINRLPAVEVWGLARP